MKEQFSTKSEQMLREMTEKRINSNRSEFSSKYLHIGGRLYKLATVLSYIAVIYNLIIFLAQSIGAYFNMIDFEIYNADKFAQAQNDLRNFIIISIILILATVMLIMKKRILYACFALIFTVFYFVNSTFVDIITSKSEITRLIIFIPAIAIMTICALYMLITCIKDYIEYKHAYTKLVDKIVATHPTKDGEITTATQWESYIEQYSEPTVHTKPKKSLRAKRRKNEIIGEDNND